MAENTGEANHVAIDVNKELSTSMGRRLQVLSSKPPQEEPPTIHRVPSVDRAAYEPKMLPIGPYHQNKLRSQATEDLKWRYLRDLLARSPSTSLHSYIKEIRSIEPQARSCYSEPIPLSSNEFTEMMVLDGCFILELLIKWSKAERDPFFIVGWNLPILRTDLLMLENQIPFLVLGRIFEASKDLAETYPTLTSLALQYLITADSKVLSRIAGVKIHHLLHLFHLSLVPTPTLHNPPSGSLMWFNVEKMRSVPMLRRYARPRSDGPRLPAPRSIPSAKELKEAGVRFRKKKEDDGSFLDVSFQKGVMEIPRLSIEYATKVRFQNLIAFEQCYPAAGDHLTSYAVFMNCLVNTEEDVVLLQGRGIIESKLGDDKSAVRFFNQVSDCGYLDYENHYLVVVYKDVTDYCESRRHRWRARLMHTHLSNPWTIISLMAAVVLLILTFLQTFYTIFPYYHPRSSP